MTDLPCHAVAVMLTKPAFEVRVFPEGKDWGDEYSWCCLAKEVDFDPEGLEISLIMSAPDRHQRRAIGKVFYSMGFKRWYRRMGDGRMRGPFKAHP